MTRKYSKIFLKFCPLEEYFRICHEKISVCSDYVLSKTKHRPKIGIICGSGLGKKIQFGNYFLLLNSDPIIGGLADLITNPDSFPYEEIPGFPQSTVEGKSELDKILYWINLFEGHVGRLLVGLLNGIPVLIMQGRFHSYEGYPLWKTAMPVRVMKLIGIEQLIATNAGGGLNQMFNVRQIT